jgi:transcription-repair coupling factor (superfamily II helicase)
VALLTLIERLSGLPAFNQLVASLPAGRGTVRVTGLPGSSDAVLIAALAEREPNRMIVLVADQLPEA